MKKGLTRERITDAALAQIEKNGLAAFSLRNLAATLEVQVSSLYNHIQGQNDLLAEVGLRAISMLTQCEEEAIHGKEKDDALFALADVYRRFAREHNELYRIVMGVHSLEIPALVEASSQIGKPILAVISQYGAVGERQIHYLRLLRSIMHGFFAHESSGSFSVLPVSRDESYRFAIGCVAAGLNAGGGNISENR